VHRVTQRGEKYITGYFILELRHPNPGLRLGARRKTAQDAEGQQMDGDILFAIMTRYKRVMPKMLPTKHLTTVVNIDD
jgi:hypothetical protein